MAVDITVRVFRRRYDGDTSSYIEKYTIDGSKLGWWKQRSGKGDFILLSAHPVNSFVSLL